MRRREFLQFAALAGAGVAGLGSAPASALDKKTRPVRILFAGSSSTYWNDMPGEIAKVISGKLRGHEGRPVSAEIVGRSGSDIRVYMEPGFKNYQYGVKQGQTFLEKVRDEKFDYLVLMTVCRFITGDDDLGGTGNAHANAVTAYCKAARDAGTEPVFYEMGWGRTEQEAQGRELILQLAIRNNIRIYAPCSSAWARVYQQRPDLKLQHPNDSVHPGDLGHFLNLACFYAAFTGESPQGKLPREYHVWPHLSKQEKEARQAELDAALARFKPDEYQARLPDWMQRNAGAGFRAAIDQATATYLENVAWQTWQDVHAKLI